MKSAGRMKSTTWMKSPCDEIPLRGDKISGLPLGRPLILSIPVMVNCVYVVVLVELIEHLFHILDIVLVIEVNVG